MNKFEQASLPAEEINISELKHSLAEWLSAGGDSEEMVRRMQLVDQRRRFLEERYPDCRRYRAFFLLSPNEIEPGVTVYDDFPGSDSVTKFIEGL